MASWQQDEDKMNSQFDDDVDDQGPLDDHYNHHHEDYSHVHGLSRLATCTTSNSTIVCDNFETEDDDHGLKTMLSRLSTESIDFGGDADEELSDYEKDKRAPCSLPGTPLQHHMQDESLFGHSIKWYASEDEARKSRRIDRRRRWKRRVLRRENKKLDDEENSIGNSPNYGSESGGGLRVITRSKGIEHSLSMDMGEVKACRDLGFELELDMKMMPSRHTESALMLDTGGATTSSGGSSPISNWRISSPGDDPKDVKARLKVWAQAVALASTSPRSEGSS